MSALHRLPGTFRSIGAVLAGLLVIVVPSIATDAVLHTAGVFRPAGQVTPDGVWLLAVGYRLVYGVVGCYVAARLAPVRPMWHAIVLGAIGMLAGLAGVAAAWGQGPEFGPRWYSFAVFALQAPCAWTGGRLGEAAVARRVGRMKKEGIEP